MNQNILNDTGNVLTYQKFRRLTKIETSSPIEADKRNRFDSFIKSKLGDSMNKPPEPIKLDELVVKTPVSISDADSFSDYDEYINAELMLPKSGEGMTAEKVCIRSVGVDGKIQRSCNHTHVWTHRYMTSCLWMDRYNS